MPLRPCPQSLFLPPPAQRDKASWQQSEADPGTAFLTPRAPLLEVAVAGSGKPEAFLSAGSSVFRESLPSPFFLPASPSLQAIQVLFSFWAVLSSSNSNAQPQDQTATADYVPDPGGPGLTTKGLLRRETSQSAILPPWCSLAPGSMTSPAPRALTRRSSGRR